MRTRYVTKVTYNSLMTPEKKQTKKPLGIAQTCFHLSWADEKTDGQTV